MYEIRKVSSRVDRELDALPDQVYDRIATAIDALASEPRPRGSLKLEDDIYRVRVGSYRIFYHIDETTQSIVIGAILRRNERTYRHISDLFP